MQDRYYDPYSQRFLSEDPIGFASTDNNFYNYVSNQPLKSTDPSGLLSYKEIALDAELAQLSYEIQRIQNEMQTCLNASRKSELESQLARAKAAQTKKSGMRGMLAAELNRLCPQGYQGGRNLLTGLVTPCESAMENTAWNLVMSYYDDGE